MVIAGMQEQPQQFLMPEYHAFANQTNNGFTQGYDPNESDLEELAEIKVKKQKLKKKPSFSEDKREVGPGAYNPDIAITRKRQPACEWGNYKTSRPNNANRQAIENPGPERYNQQQNSIQMKMVKGILQQEEALDKQTKKDINYNRLIQRLSQKTKAENEIKKEKYIMKKMFIESKVQPGAHQNLKTQSDFRATHKPEFLQFFGSTDCRISEGNFMGNKNPNVGPGSYEQYKQSLNLQKRANTANFAGGRKDSLF